MATKKQNPLGSLVPIVNKELVNQAYRMSMANVPKDLSNIHKRIGDSYAAGVSAIGQAFKDVFIAAGNTYAAIKEQKDEEDEELSSGRDFLNGGQDGSDIYSSGQKIHKDFHKYGTRYGTTDSPVERSYQVKDQFGNDETLDIFNFDHYLNFLKQDKKKARKIKDKDKRKSKLAEINKKEENARNSIIAFGKAELEINDIIENGDFTETATNSQKANFLLAIKANGEPIDGVDGNKVRAVKGYNSQGEAAFVYINQADGKPILDGSGNPITVKPGGVKNLVSKRNLEMRTKINQVGISTRDYQGKGNKMTSYYSDNNINDIKSYITNKADFLDAIGFTPEGFGQNFEQAVYGQGGKGNIELSDLPLTVLSSLPKDFVSDDDNSGGVSAGDFNSKENYKKLADALLDPTNKNFDLERSKTVIASFFNDKFKTDGAGEYNVWAEANPDIVKERERKAKGTTSPTTTPTQDFYANLEKTEGGRQAINRLNNFMSMVGNEKTKGGRIDIAMEKSGAVTSYLEVEKTDKGLKLNMNYYNSATEQTEKRQVDLREASQVLSGNSGASLDVIFGNKTLEALKNNMAPMEKQTGFGAVGMPNNVFGVNKATAASNFKLQFKDFTGLSIKAQGFRGSNVIFTFGENEFEFDPGAEDQTAETNRLKAWFMANNIQKAQ